jgi:hypothetical protein
MLEVTNGVFCPEDLTDYQGVRDKAQDFDGNSRKVSQE